MVDRKTDNHVDVPSVNVVDHPAWEIALGMLGGFRALVDEAHARLAGQGHPDVRPAYGFALQAVGTGATANEVAGRLGVSKQAAGKTLWRLEAEGYVVREADPHDARRRVIVLTEHGRSLLSDTIDAFEDVVGDWANRIGTRKIEQLHGLLMELDVLGSAKLDLGSWSS